MDVVFDPDNPPLTPAQLSSARRLRDIPVDELLGKRTRGPQKSPTKELISIRLSQDVLTALRQTGIGWQARVDDILRDWVKQHG